jgi:short-subunit dehydrogenase
MDLAGTTVLVTGASRGIGISIATLLATRQAKLVLAARSVDGLERLAASIRSGGGVAHVVPIDLSASGAAEELLTRTEALAGPVDVLVNNAGIEGIARFHELDPAEFARVLYLNLEVPMRLCRALLPGMLQRGRGHLVNLASLAGLAGRAHSEAYCASKHGLVGFTRSLRASLRAHAAPVSASVVCPGFVSGEGMFADTARTHGLEVPRLIGTSTPEHVAYGVLRAVAHDLPEVIVNPGPMRPLLALGTLSPRLAEWLTPKFGADDLSRKVVAQGGVKPR